MKCLCQLVYTRWLDGGARAARMVSLAPAADYDDDISPCGLLLL